MDEKTHQHNQINGVNPELAQLLGKVEVIHLVTGGTVVKKPHGKKQSKYSITKQEIRAKISNIEGIQERLESGLYSQDSKEYIGMKNTLRGEYTQLSNDIVKFTDLSKDNTEPKEVEEQQEIISQVKNIIPKYKQITIRDEKTYPTNTVDDLMSGKLAKRNQEAITSAQHQMLTEIDDETKIQDDVLNSISISLEDLKNLANTINDTVSTQNEILKNTIEKTDHTTIIISDAADRTKDLVKKINSKSGKICTYIVCVVILLALVLFAYNMIKKS
jgi:hypothetical protein